VLEKLLAAKEERSSDFSRKDDDVANESMKTLLKPSRSSKRSPAMMEGWASLRIDLTTLGRPLTFHGLGVAPRLRLELVNRRRFSALGAALAVAVFGAGLALARRRIGVRAAYVAAVMLATLLIPLLPALAGLALALNPAFHAAAALIVFYPIAGIVRRWAARRRRGAASGALAAALTALCLGAAQPASAATPGLPAPAAAGGEPVSVRIVSDVEPVQVPTNAVVVPYDTANRAAAGSVMIPYARYLELLRAAEALDRPQAAKPAAPFSLAGAVFECTLTDTDAVAIEETVHLEVFDAAGADIPLRLEGAVLAKAELDGRPAQIGMVWAAPPNAPQQQTQQAVGPVATPGLMLLRVPDKGRHVLKLSLRAHVTRRGGWRVVEARLPAAPAALMRLVVPTPGTDVNLPGAPDRKSQRTTVAGQTIETALGAEGRFGVEWRGSVAEGEKGLALTVDSRAVFDVREDRLQLIWSYRPEFRSGERDVFQVQVPADYVVEKVEGQNVRGWEVPGVAEGAAGAQTLRVELLKAAAREEQFTIHLWKPGPVPAGDAQEVTVPAVLSPGASRQTGRVVIRRSPLLDVRTLEVSGAQRCDLPADAAGLGVPVAAQESPLGIEAYEAYEFVSVPFALRLRVASRASQVSALVRTVLRVAEDETHIESRVELNVEERPLHGLRVQLPAGYTLEAVSGPTDLEWTVAREVEGSIVTVYLAGGLKGRVPLVLKAKADGARAEGVTLPVVRVLDVARQEGDLVVETDPAFDVRPEGVAGLENLLPRQVYGWLNEGQRPLARLAFHYRTPEYRGRVTLQRREPDVSGRLVTNLRLTDRAIEETVLVRLRIHQAGVRRVQLRLPARLRDARIGAPYLRERTLGETADGAVLVTLDLQDEVLGELNILIEDDRVLTAATQTLTLATLLTGRTDREYVALENAGRDEVVVASAAGLEPLEREQKEWAAVAPLLGGGLTRAYVVRAQEGRRPELVFRTQRREAVQTAGARVGLARARVLLDESGAYRAEQSFHVENQTEQFLDIDLPGGAELWTATVAGEYVKPVTAGGPTGGGARAGVRIPLVKTETGDADYVVTLKYGGRLGALGAFAVRDFPLVRSLNVNVELAQVELWLPVTHDWFHFGGSMRAVEEEGTFEAGYLSYQNKQAQRLVKTLQFGNVFEKARAVENLKSVSEDLEQAQQSVQRQYAFNEEANLEAANVGGVLREAEKELERVGQEDQQSAYDDNRRRLNHVFLSQTNVFGRNQVLQGVNWSDEKAAAEGGFKTQTLFNGEWFERNGLALSAGEGEADETKKKDGAESQPLGESGDGKPELAKSPVVLRGVYASRDSVKPSAYQQKLEVNEKERRRVEEFVDGVYVGKDGQQDMAARYRGKLANRANEPDASDNRERRMGDQWSGDAPADQKAQSSERLLEEIDTSARLPEGRAVPGVGLGVTVGSGGMAYDTAGTATRTDPAYWGDLAGTGLASLDVALPGADGSRWRVWRFTTPRGVAEIRGYGVSAGALDVLRRVGVLLATLLVLWLGAVLCRAGARRESVLSWLPATLILVGAVALLVGVLPVGAGLAIVCGIVLRVKRARAG
jgi:hypothetical protein